MNYERDNFPQGVVVFFRALLANGQFASSVLPRGRQVIINGRGDIPAHEDDYVVADRDGRLLGCFPREFVTAILPLETTGPGVQDNAGNSPQQSQH